MQRRTHFLAALCVGLLAVGVMQARAQVTMERLLKEMVDMPGMAEFPSPAYTTWQASSWDRKSTDSAKQTQENWFANADFGQFLRVEERNGRKEHVMMDAQGPGAIVRIWSANPKGNIRFYIDGSDKPALEAKMTDLLGGSFPGLPKPIAGEYSKGWNLYFPIIYAKSCKVTADDGGFYYHVNYRTYEAGTKVVPFELAQIQASAEQIQQVAARLTLPRMEDPQDVQPFEMQIEPGQSTTVQFTGSQAITRIAMTVNAADRELALRGLVVRIQFDGEKTVETPLGDFFGTAPGINAYASLPLGMTKEGQLWSQWVMPFQQSAEITIENTTKTPAVLRGAIALTDYKWTDASMHFHAKWRSQFDVPSRPMIDMNYLTAKGKGVFAGVAFMIDNPVKDWWGEGDEKIYFDGQAFPSHFGTGTEDYYGYAWCWPGLFTHAYHAQPRCDGPGNYGRTSVNRFHIIDRIPFTKDFKFDMELWHWKECDVNMAVIAYWYARPGATDTFKPIQAADLTIRPMPKYTAPKVAGVLEGESLKVVQKVGQLNPQDWDGVSDGKHLWWNAGMKPGDKIVVAFEAPKAGKYRVMARFLRAKDYGIHQLAINGQSAGEPIDFYSPDVRISKEMDMGVHELKQGENQLSVTVVGANAKAEGVKYMFGLDYVLLKAAE